MVLFLLFCLFLLIMNRVCWFGVKVRYEGLLVWVMCSGFFIELLVLLKWYIWMFLLEFLV